MLSLAMGVAIEIIKKLKTSGKISFFAHRAALLYNSFSDLTNNQPHPNMRYNTGNNKAIMTGNNNNNDVNDDKHACDHELQQHEQREQTKLAN